MPSRAFADGANGIGISTGLSKPGGTGLGLGLGGSYTRKIGQMAARLSFEMNSQSTTHDGVITNAAGVDEDYTGSGKHTQTFMSVDGFFMPPFAKGLAAGFRLGYLTSKQSLVAKNTSTATEVISLTSEESGIGMGVSFFYDLKVGSFTLAPEFSYVMGVIGVSDTCLNLGATFKYSF